MNKHLFVAAILTLALPSSWSRAQENTNVVETEKTDSVQQAFATHADSIVNAYLQSLQNLVTLQQQATGTASSPSPYLFRLFGPGTLYNNVLTQKMSLDAEETENTAAAQRPQLGSTTDKQLQLAEDINNALAQAYISSPQFFSTTQQELMSTSRIRSDLSKKEESNKKLAEKVVEDKPQMQVDVVDVEVMKPNFWTLKGNGGMQFTQNHFSDNWYQGGDDMYSMLTLLTLDANYDNKRKIQWDNRFEAQLGFQTTENSKPKFRATSNLLRLTSKLGVKAIGKWNYAAQLQLQSQPYMTYDGSGENVVADFISPLYIRSSLGMDYKFNWKTLSGSLYLAPLSWNVTYVDRDPLVTRYGINEGHNSKHDWGPNINLTFSWKLMKNITWSSRAYWFSNLKLTRIEWENTFNFTVNKYISAKLFIYPRFEDSSPNYRSGENHDGTYWMFKEFLSLGLNYDF